MDLTIDEKTYNKFDISKLKEFNNILIIGKVGSGKSRLIKDILIKNNMLNKTMAISPTEALNNFYSNIISPLLTYDKLDNRLIDKIKLRQNILIRSNQDANLNVILDDCDLVEHLRNNEFLNLFIYNSRLYKLNNIMTTEYSNITPTIRSNIDYVIFMNDNFTNDKQKLYNHYGRAFASFDQFERVFDKMTLNYGCMVIDNKSRSNNITESVFWYKADI